MKKISVIAAALVGAAMLCAAPISLHQGLTLSVDKAQARIGRPLSPGSIAGVHRRHDRRAYRRGTYGTHGYAYRGHHRPYGYHGYRRGYYGRPYVGGYYGHQRRVGRRVHRRHNY